MIEIKELDMHLEDNTLVHNTKGHEKREGHRWKGKSAAYVEVLFEYVWKVADHFMPAYVEPWEEGEEPSDAPVTFARRYLSGNIEHREQMLERFSDEQIQNTIRAYRLDVDKLWYLMCLVADYVNGLCEFETRKGLVDTLNEMNRALGEATEVTFKKDDAKLFSTTRKEVLEILDKAMEYFAQCYNDAVKVEDDEEKKKRLGELGLDHTISNTEYLDTDKEWEQLLLTYRQYRFAKMMLWFIKDIKPATPKGIKVKVFRERHLFVSMMLYVCGIYKESDDEARSKWYEPYYLDKENRNLSNLVRNYKYREQPKVVNKWFGY